MKNRVNKFMSFLIGLILSLSAVAPAFAIELPDLDAVGSITLVIMDHNEDPKTPVPGGTLTLYRVGSPAYDDGNFSFEIDGIYDPVKDVVEDYSADEAQKISDYIDRTDAEFEKTTVQIDGEGKAVFGNVKVGLFLVRQEEAAVGYMPIAPFFITMPQNLEGKYVYEVDGEAKTLPEPKKYTPVTDDPSVTKTVEGKPKEDAEFTFTLEAISTSVAALGGVLPMPEGSEDQKKEITITGEGTGSFGAISFNTPGTYVYKVSEAAGKDEKYTYSKTVFEVTYEVSADGEKLTVKKTVTADGEEAEGIKFTNVYREEETTPSSSVPESTPPSGVPVLGVNSRTRIYAVLGILLGVILLSAGILALKKGKKN